MSYPNIQQLVRRIFLFSVPILLGCILLEYYNRNRIGNEIICKLKLIEDYSDSANTLIIGNSHGRNGLISSEFSSMTINCAIGGSTLFYSKEVLEKFFIKSESSSLKNIILTISYQTLFKDFHRESTISKRYEFYHYLNSSYDLPHSFDLRKFSIIQTVSFHSAFENVIDDFNLNQNLTYENLGYTPTYNSVNENVAAEIARKRIGVHHDMMSEEQIILDENLGYLLDIIGLSRKNDVNLFIIITPTTPDYFNLQKPPYNIYNDIVKRICDQEGVIYKDYSNNDAFKNLSLFNDADHLNYQGAKILTSMVIEDFCL